MSRRAFTGILLAFALGCGALAVFAGAGDWLRALAPPAPLVQQGHSCTALAMDRATGVTRAVPCATPVPALLIADQAR